MNTKSPAFLMVMFVVMGILFAVGGKLLTEGWLDSMDELRSTMDDEAAREAYLKRLEQSMAEREARDEAIRQAPPPEPQGTNYVAIVGGLVGVSVLGVVLGLVVFGGGSEREKLPPLPPLDGEGLGGTAQGGPDGRQPAPQDQEAREGQEEAGKGPGQPG